MKLTDAATGFGLPFGLAGKIALLVLLFPGKKLTMLVSQSGRQRRTSLKCIEDIIGKWIGLRKSWHYVE